MRLASAAKTGDSTAVRQRRRKGATVAAGRSFAGLANDALDRLRSRPQRDTRVEGRKGLLALIASKGAVCAPWRTRGVAFIGLDGREGDHTKEKINEVYDLDSAIPRLKGEVSET